MHTFNQILNIFFVENDLFVAMIDEISDKVLAQFIFNDDIFGKLGVFEIDRQVCDYFFT